MQFLFKKNLYIFVDKKKEVWFMSSYIYDVAKSLGFGVRNDVKAMGNGSDADVRAVVGGIQTTNAGTSIFAEAKKGSTISQTASSAAKYVSKAVNPLLCVAGVARVAASDDRPSTAIEEICGMSTMFGVEGVMKQQFKEGSLLSECKLMKNSINGFNKYCANNNFLSKFKAGTIGNMIKGLAFIIGSMSAYALGQSIGSKIADKTTRKYSFVPLVNDNTITQK